jgi:Pin2-interacting protein X1
MLGIGAASSREPNGVAWKQNHDFEALLRRLNDGAGNEDGGIGGEKVGEVETSVGGRADADIKRKRKRKTDRGDVDEHKEKKKRKKERVPNDPSSSQAQDTSSVKTVGPRPMACVLFLKRHGFFIDFCIYSSHRARHIASKRLASKSASAISEILGIAHTPSPSPLPQSTPMPMPGTLTQLDDDHTLEKLTTSTKSVADYFKDRLGAKAKASGRSSPLHSSNAYAYEAPRAGLGSLRLGRGAREEGQASTAGLGTSKFGTLTSGAFLASLFNAEEANTRPVNQGVDINGPADDVFRLEEKDRGKHKGKHKRDAKRKRKEVGIVEWVETK